MKRNNANNVRTLMDKVNSFSLYVVLATCVIFIVLGVLSSVLGAPICGVWAFGVLFGSFALYGILVIVVAVIELIREVPLLLAASIVAAFLVTAIVTAN